jgi:histidinol-phosphatase
MTNALDDDLRFAHQLAEAADAITRAAFALGTSLEHDLKDDGTPVSETDRAVEQALLAHVQEHRPDDAFLGEEVGAHGRSHRRWVVDGVDGTNNFVAGDPRWGTLIALVEDDLTVVGLNTGPAQGRRWWAARGRGAWTAALHPDGGTEPAVALEVAATPADPPRACVELAWEGHPTRPIVDRMTGRVQPVAMTTHAGLLVANGEADLAVHVAGGPWDFAAVMVIVWEAGGRCVDLTGADVEDPQPPIVYLGGLQPAALRHLLDG